MAMMMPAPSAPDARRRQPERPAFSDASMARLISASSPPAMRIESPVKKGLNELAGSKYETSKKFPASRWYRPPHRRWRCRQARFTESQPVKALIAAAEPGQEDRDDHQGRADEGGEATQAAPDESELLLPWEPPCRTPAPAFVESTIARHQRTPPGRGAPRLLWRTSDRRPRCAV